jgi:hypothetical protein
MNDISPASAAAYDRRTEVESLLADDTTVLGHLWAYEQDGLTPQEMAEREGTSGTGWVSVYRMLVRVLRDGEVPTAPSMSTTAARRVRRWLKNPNLSPSLRGELEAQVALLTSRAEDPSAVAEETETAVETSKRAEATGRPGVYVWSLPHYLNYPVDQKRGHTLYKVGHSSVDAYNRVRDARWVGLPEDPVLRRIYPADASAAAEREFHEALRAADHFQQVNVKAGSEWYLSSLRYLDYIARRMGLDVEEYNAQYETGTE